jgi:hypothetical protein
MHLKVLAILAIAIVSACAPAPEKVPSGQTAPDFTVTTFAGEEFRLAEQRGSPVVLNFWESW